MLRKDPMPTPLWLTNTEWPAPCFCGEPALPGEPLVLMEGDEGLKRVVHVRCIPDDMIADDDE